jgi:hypothetical protein
MELKEDNSGHSGDVEEVARSPIVRLDVGVHGKTYGGRASPGACWSS